MLNPSQLKASSLIKPPIPNDTTKTSGSKVQTIYSCLGIMIKWKTGGCWCVRPTSMIMIIDKNSAYFLFSMVSMWNWFNIVYHSWEILEIVAYWVMIVCDRILVAKFGSNPFSMDLQNKKIYWNKIIWWNILGKKTIYIILIQVLKF